MDEPVAEPFGRATPAEGSSPTASPVLSGTYPERWEADVALTDGGTMLARPIRPDDAELLVSFHERQSPESIYFRFFSPRPHLSKVDVDRFTQVDYVDRMAFIGVVGDDMVGVARYDRLPTSSVAEVAFFVDDAHRGRGIATVLLEYLAVAAREVGISGFTASVLPQNRRMLGVFTAAGFKVKSRFAEGVIEVELAIDPTPEALAAIEARAKVAEARSVERLLRPGSIAVVGASREPGSIGHSVFLHLVTHGFEGRVYAVNPTSSHVAGVPTWPSVLDLPGHLDLAIIAVPHEDVRQVVEHCAIRRVQGLVIISSGFADRGPEGAAAEAELVSYARRNGMRVIGPNCLGIINMAADVRMHATFADIAPLRGRLAVSAQSGTVGAAIVEHASSVGLGISTFVAVGNKADVSGNDLLQFWERDPETDVVLLYVESFGNPRKFVRIARRFSQDKPIVVVKIGAGAAAGARRPWHAVDGRAGEVVATEPEAPEGWPSDATVSAMLEQTGVVRVDTLTHMFGTAKVLIHQPLPRGRRVAILSNAWGPARLAADACVQAGLDLAVLGASTRAQVGTLLASADGIAGHRVDLPNDVGPEEVRGSLHAVLSDDGVDAVMVLYASPVAARADEVAAAVVAASAEADEQTVVACFFGHDGPELLDDGTHVVPSFPFPEEAALALVRVARYAEWRRAPKGALPDYDDADSDAAQALVHGWLEGRPEGRWLDSDEAAQLLATYGLAPVAGHLADDADEVVAHARRIGYPVALKATGLVRLAKTEAGGVSLDIHGDDEVRRAHERMVGLLGAAMTPTLVQAMAEPGVDCVIGLHRHPVLGDVMTLGVGGAIADHVEGVGLRILPITDADAGRLIEDSPVAAMIEEAGPAARSALNDRLLRLGALAEAIPEIAQARLNPVLVSAAGAAITDVRIRIEPWMPDPRPEVRRLG